MANFYEVNFNSGKQAELQDFLEKFKKVHGSDKQDWYFIRGNNLVNAVQFAVPEHVKLDGIGVPKPGMLATVIGALRYGSATFYAMSPCDEMLFDGGILIFHDGLFFSEYDTKAKKLLTIQSIPDTEHVAKTPHGIGESIQRWIPWSYLSPNLVGVIS